jgi:hypothetical protein
MFSDTVQVDGYSDTDWRKDIESCSFFWVIAKCHWMTAARRLGQRVVSISKGGICNIDPLTLKDETTTLSQNFFHHPPSEAT